eukprot:6191201-Pleurochrysis_carterae.AAC.6
MNLDSRTNEGSSSEACVAPPSTTPCAPAASPASSLCEPRLCEATWCARESSSILPTISVVETPSVRGMVRYLPARTALSYTSRPSTRHGSSPCTT